MLRPSTAQQFEETFLKNVDNYKVQRECEVV